MAFVYGTSFADTLGGRAGATSDSDYIFGYEGADKLYGLGGNDTLRGGEGADMLDGGSGFDVADYYSSASGVFVNLVTGKGAGGDAQGDELVSIEGVYGSKHDDTIFGDDNDNWLWGFGGSDSLKGFGGQDFIFGHGGDDTLLGMDGNDALFGDDGDDYICGGMGLDGLVGGGGADRFVWTSTDQAPVLTGSDGVIYDACRDVIDFNPADGDLIDLHSIDADVYAAGNQAFTFIGAAAFTGTPGEINYHYANGDTYIQMQTGTATDIEAIIRIVGIHTPEADWFVL